MLRLHFINATLVAGFLLLAVFSYCQPAHHYAVLKKFSIASNGAWDYIAVHAGRLYVSHGTQVNILDEATGDSVGVILNTAGVHGIAFDPALNKGFTSNGRTNNVTVFNLETAAPTGTIATGENPDAILYEPFSNSIITCNGKSNDLSVIDPVSEKVKATIRVGGKPETAVADGRGTLFVNIEDKNEVVAVDLNTFAVKHHWSLLPAQGPTGLALDAKTGRLFSSCDQVLAVLDAATGKLIDKLPIGKGSDGVVFDAKARLIFTSNGEGSITVIEEKSATDFSVLGNIATKRGARTIAMDKNDGTLFLPTADFESGTPATGRPKMIPGSFQVLVVR